MISTFVHESKLYISERFTGVRLQHPWHIKHLARLCV